MMAILSTTDRGIGLGRLRSWTQVTLQNGKGQIPVQATVWPQYEEYRVAYRQEIRCFKATNGGMPSSSRAVEYRAEGCDTETSLPKNSLKEKTTCKVVRDHVSTAQCRRQKKKI